MKQLEIEWRHLDKEGKTCERCADTGTEVRQAVEDLRGELQPAGWRVSFKETRLTELRIAESNAILLNGIPLEELLPQARTSQSCCDSCGDILGTPTLCRTIEHNGQSYEAIPAALIRQAAYRLINQQKDS